MNYEINVAQNGQHVFLAQGRGVHTEEKASKLYALICDRFSSEDGYEITLTQWETRGWNLMTRRRQ